MTNIFKALIALSCLAFITAVLGSMFHFDFLGTDPEGFSRASNNLALIAIALAICFRSKGEAPDTDRRLKMHE